MKRRTFLLAGAGALGALVVGWGVLPPRQRLYGAAPLSTTDGEVALNGWIKLTPEGDAVLVMARSEMGQGVLTALSMLAAEELDLPLARILRSQVGFDKIYGNVAVMEDMPLFRSDDTGVPARLTHWLIPKIARELGINITGASTTMHDLWLPIREAAAHARTSLVASVARAKGVAAGQCRTEAGFILLPGGERIGYGEGLKLAGTVVPASSFKLKSPDQFTLIGQPATRVDAREKTDGTAIFGVDVRLPGMLYAALVMPPSFGAKLVSFETPKSLTAVRVPAAAGQGESVAVIADGWWQARQAAESLKVVWDESAHAGVNDETLVAARKRGLQQGEGKSYYAKGDVDAAFAQAAKIVEAEYQLSYLAHATMEPMNCTAQVKDGKVRVWAPSQTPTVARMTAARMAGVDEDATEVTITQLGGGLGRRGESDYVAQAVAIAAQADGRPVQMIWSREQDMQHDFYRPASNCRIRAALDAGGRLLALETKLASDSFMTQSLPRIHPRLPGGGSDRTTDVGLCDQPYTAPAERHLHVQVEAPVPIGAWRGVNYGGSGFMIESFVDELAAAVGKDPLALRRELLAGRPRFLETLELAATQAGYNPLRQQELKAQGRAMGIAVVEAFGSVMAEIAEVSIVGRKPRVHRVVAAVHCGLAVNPDIIAQQIEGGIVMGLSAALYENIRIDRGHAVQDNFTRYDLARMADAPVVETHIVKSADFPTGIGETGLPPIAPAIANAVFALTGQRLRTLPLTLA